MPSQTIIVDADFGPGFSTEYTVPDDLASGVVTFWQVTNGGTVPNLVRLYHNGVTIVSEYITTASTSVGGIVRVPLAAGDTVELYSNEAGSAGIVVANNRF